MTEEYLTLDRPNASPITTEVNIGKQDFNDLLLLGDLGNTLIRLAVMNTN
jgi:hypothetical protein